MMLSTVRGLTVGSTLGAARRLCTPIPLHGIWMIDVTTPFDLYMINVMSVWEREGAYMGLGVL